MEAGLSRSHLVVLGGNGSRANWFTTAFFQFQSGRLYPPTTILYTNLRISLITYVGIITGVALAGMKQSSGLLVAQRKQNGKKSQLGRSWAASHLSWEAADAHRCNHDVVNQTTPVDAYPAGQSAYNGCYDDMLGNVWEWTASVFQGYEGFVSY